MSEDDPATEPSGFVELAQLEVDPRSVRLLDRETCREKQVVMLGKVDPHGSGPVRVGMLPPVRRSLVREIGRLLCRPVEPVPLNDWEIRRALDLGWGEAGPGSTPARSCCTRSPPSPSPPARRCRSCSTRSSAAPSSSGRATSTSRPTSRTSTSASASTASCGRSLRRSPATTWRR
jgi:hypothetical protein